MSDFTERLIETWADGQVLDAHHAMMDLTLRITAKTLFNAELNAACASHSRDMAVQNRPWHFGSDGSSPLVRVQRVGYTGKLLEELISETYQTELETLSAWMNQADTRDALLDVRATQIGFAWFQEPNGKIWWTLLVGTDAATVPSPRV